MAVEAQLCPQCGAAIQFVEGQAEVVCAYCGMIVVRPAAPATQSEASVEKELAAEKLVQETVEQEKSCTLTVGQRRAGSSPRRRLISSGKQLKAVQS